MSNVLTLFPHHNIAESLRELADEIDSGEVELSKLLLCVWVYAPVHRSGCKTYGYQVG